MSNDLKNVKGLAILIATITFVILLFDWLFYTQLVRIPSEKEIWARLGFKIVYVFHKVLYLIRLIFVAASGLAFYASNRVRKKEVYHTTHYIVSAICIIIFLVKGYSFNFYNLYIYPVLVLLNVLAVYILVSYTHQYLEDQMIFGLSKKGTQNKFGYRLKVQNKETHQVKVDYLDIHSPHQHIYIQGGSGSGKGGSLFHTLIYQSIEMNLPGVIYSYKGHHSKLVKTAYLAYYHQIKKGITPNATLKLFNGIDLSRSFRANPIAPKYLPTAAHAKTMATVIAIALNKDWIKKFDEWAKWSVSIIHSLIWKLACDHPNLCSLPFLVEILYYENAEAIINFIESNNDSKKLFRSVSLAKDGSVKQFTGIITTVLSGFTSLISKEMYWLLSADEINFDITDPVNPELIIICNDEDIKESVSPVISAIFSVVMKKTNKSGKLNGFMCLDEIHTQYFHDLDTYANTARENGMSIHIGNQEISMLYDLWGVEKGDNVRGACGNQFYGMAGTEKSAKIPVEMLSNIDIVNWSFSDSSESSSQSETLKEKKAMQTRDVMGLKTGEFIGKIANGTPPYFKEQFMLFEYEKSLDEIEIPPFVLDEYTPEELSLAVEKNYQEIQNKVHELLLPYIPEEVPKEKVQ